jgi:hypothetical protein
MLKKIVVSCLLVVGAVACRAGVKAGPVRAGGAVATHR